MFRAGGIYYLPNGRELMASGDGASFYAQTDDSRSILRYELNEAGRLLLDGRLTAWDVTALQDSNRNAEITPPAHSSPTTSDLQSFTITS